MRTNRQSAFMVVGLVLMIVLDFRNAPSADPISVSESVTNQWRLVLITNDPLVDEQTASASSSDRELGSGSLVVNSLAESAKRVAMNWLSRADAPRLSPQITVRPVGMPASLGGGEQVSPSNLIVAVVDHHARLIAFGVGLPDERQFDQLMSDAADVASTMSRIGGEADQKSPEFEAAPETRRAWFQRWVDRSRLRVDHFYASHLLQFARRVSSRGPSKVDDPMLAQKQDASAPTTLAAFQTIEEVESPHPWIAPATDDKDLFVGKTANVISEDRLISIACEWFEPFYRNDAMTRFDLTPQFKHRELLVWQQHWKTRKRWYECLTPWVVGQPLDAVIETIGSTCFMQPVATLATIDVELERLTRNVSEPVVLDLQYWPETEAQWTFDPTSAGEIEPEVSSSAGVSLNFQERLSTFERVEVSTGQLLALQRAGRLPALSLLQTAPLMHIILTEQANPILIRRGDDIGMIAAKIERLIRQTIQP